MTDKQKTQNIISIINMKGGVGKTSLTVNTALNLSENNKVLVVDIDPQFNTTQSLLEEFELLNIYDDLTENKYTIVKIFEKKKRRSETMKKNPAAPKTQVEFPEIQKLDDNLHLIPGDLALTEEIDALTVDNLKSYFNSSHIKSYDIILIDCPPTWSLYSQAALKASDMFLIPAKVDPFSLYGIKILLDKMEDVQGSNRNLICLGLVYTMISESKSKLGITAEQLTYKSKVEDFLTESAYEDYGIQVEPFKSMIPFHKLSSYNSISIKRYDPEKTKTNELLHTKYNDFFKELSERLSDSD